MSFLLCGDSRCRTLLPAEAEICDECGGALRPPAAGEAVLVGAGEDRQVAFELGGSGSLSVGRAGDGSTPDVDLEGLPGCDSVHHLHASLDGAHGAWTITHRGRNPLLIHRGAERIALELGGSAALQSGDNLVLGRLGLAFVIAGSAG